MNSCGELMMNERKPLDYGAVSIGIGAMIGAGIFSILGSLFTMK